MKNPLLSNIIFFLLLVNNSYSNSDTIFIMDDQSGTNIVSFVHILEDKNRQLTIDNILEQQYQSEFIKYRKEDLNFGISKSNIWMKLVLVNRTNQTQNLILCIQNPDLDEVDFFEFTESSLSRSIYTGELRDISTRKFFHRHFLFNLSLIPDITYTYYISTNNLADAIFIPVVVMNSNKFEILDFKYQIIHVLIYGLLLFIVIFNLYLFVSVKDLIYLYYSLYVLFAILLNLTADGYLHQFLSKWLINRFTLIKWLFPPLACYFLLSFSQVFLQTPQKHPGINKLFSLFKLISLVFIIMPFINISIIKFILIIGLPILFVVIYTINIVVSTISINKKYLPNHFFLAAFSFIMIAIIIYQLRDFAVLSSNIITENALRFGLAIESLLLTFAVLERFRIEQENSTKTIQESYEKIQDQKNELVKVNTELEKLSVVASETENSVAIYDIDGNMEWCNAGFERLYDTTFEELLKDGNNNIRNIANHDNIEQLINFSIENKQAVFFENMIKTKKKKQVWLQTTITPYFSRETSLTKLIAIDSDISELKLYERNLTIAKDKAEESDRLKTSFLANMSHEIRTPLNGIIGFSDLLKRDDLTKEKRIRYFDIIDTNGQQLLNLIDDILDISLIESNQLKISITEFDINVFMDEIFEFYKLYKKNTGKENIEFSLNKGLKESGYLIKSDPDRLRQVLSNLMNNAFKFTEKGKISFGYAPDNSCLKFFVEDSGPGISNTQKDTLFKRFRQGEETLKRKHGGAGLGLSISKGIIDLLGGNIWHDESYKEGARFYFTLPVI